ncbi:MAG TPA: SDR family oxidoreductase [Candidatus Acidoferrum sp.]|nr:SDR family oxidoreductase [Candidatus Acidoferrum sp.]
MAVELAQAGRCVYLRCTMTNTKKVVLVTGASAGFGRLFTETLARHQYTVFSAMRNLSGKNAAAARELQQLADREALDIQSVELDVTQDASCEQCVKEVIRRAGRLDVLLNNAGIAYLGLAESFTLAQAHRIFETNFFGVLRMVRAVLPRMHQQHSGLLMQVSSGAGRAVLPGMGLYCASKFALEALTEALRYELASSGIDSVSLEPGAYRTAILGKIEAGEDGARNAPYGRAQEVPGMIGAMLNQAAADPQEVADAVLQIIETPLGRRELRYRVGKGASGVEAINAVTKEQQEQMLTLFGVADFTKFPAEDAAKA